jgi:hypothetical protein
MHNVTYVLYNKLLKSNLNFFNAPSSISEVTASDCVTHHVVSYRLLTAGPGFDPKPVKVGFVVGGVALADASGSAV